MGKHVNRRCLARRRKERHATAAAWCFATLVMALVSVLVASLVTVVPVWAAGSLGGPTWFVSSNTTGAGALYSWRFVTASSGNSNVVAMTATVPPGTTVAPGGLVVTDAGSADYSNPIGLSNAQATLNSQTGQPGIVTVTFTPTGQIAKPGHTIFIDVDGFINTPTAQSYRSTVSTYVSTAIVPGDTAALDTGTTAPVEFTTVGLSGLSWSATSSIAGASGTSYTYTLRVPSATTVSKVTISVPSGTTGSALTADVTPSSLRDGGITLAEGLLTYTPPGGGVAVDSKSTVTVTVTGLTNASTITSYAAQVVVYAGSMAVAAGTTPTLTVASSALTSPSWASTSTSAGSPTTYTWTFTMATGANLAAVTMTVPVGTTGTPALGPVTAVSLDSGNTSITLSGQAITLVGTTLIFSFTREFVNPATISIIVTGLTTSEASGTYASNIATLNIDKKSTIPAASGSPAASSSTNMLSLSDTKLGTPLWSASSTVTGATNVTYTYSFTVSVDAPVAAITMTVPQGTTAGSGLKVASASPAALAPGPDTNIRLDGAGTMNPTLVYTFDSTTLPAGTHAALVVDGLTNTATRGAYTSAITVEDSGTAILASAVTTPITFSSTVLSGPAWTQSSQATSTTNVTYTYGFTITADENLSGVTMTVPNGTLIGASPTVTVTSTSKGSVPAIVALIGSTLAVTFVSAPGSTTEQLTYFPAGTRFTVMVTGMTNTPVPANYSSIIAATYRGTPVESGTSAPTTFVGGPIVAGTWHTSQTTAGSDVVAYTFAFTTASTSPLTSITVALPVGTSGSALTLGSVSSSLPAGGSVSFAGATLTYAFPATTVQAGTPLSFQVAGFTNPLAPGSYTATITTLNGTGRVDDGATSAVTFVPQSLVFTNECTVPAVSCALTGTGGTGITLLVVPAGGTASADITLTVTTNAAHGYVVAATMSPLSNGHGGTIMQAPVRGSTDPNPDRFAATATLSAAAGTGAALCPPFGTAAAAGFPTDGSVTNLWYASAGGGTDTVTLRNTIGVSAVQPAGTYTGTISYRITPAYTGAAAC